MTEPIDSVVSDMLCAVAHAISKDADGHADLEALVQSDFEDSLRTCTTNRQRAACCRRWLRALQ